MSESIKPWIANYLVDVAESFSSLLNVKAHAKGKKVQLVEFLTSKQSENDNCIWAVASDKQLEIPVCFKEQALKTFYPPGDHQDSQAKELVEYRGALAIIKCFKPIFRRVPKKGGGLTTVDVLSLEVDYVSITGCIGEPTFGSPREVSSQALLKEWIEGLRKGGRGGYILKERKEERECREAEDGPVAGPSKANRGGVEKSMKTLDSVVENKRSVDYKNNYNNKWSKIRRNSKKFAVPPDDADIHLAYGNKQDSGLCRPTTPKTVAPTTRTPDSERKRRNRRRALDFSTSPERTEDKEDGTGDRLAHSNNEGDDKLDGGRISGNGPHTDVGAKDSHLHRSSPSTPSQWSLSSPPLPFHTHAGDDGATYDSPTRSSVHKSDSKPMTAADLTFSSSLTPPTPAQRPRPVIFSSSLPTSSFPRAPEPLDKAKSLPLLGVDKRHVPLPVVPPAAMASSQVQGRGNVLVPNSDTSGTTSQSQHNQSQSQQSQRFPMGSGWSQMSAVLGNVVSSSSQVQNAVAASEEVPMLVDSQSSARHPDKDAEGQAPSVNAQGRGPIRVENGDATMERGRVQPLDVDDALTHARLVGPSQGESSRHSSPRPRHPPPSTLFTNPSRPKRPRSPSITGDRYPTQKERRIAQQKDVHDTAIPKPSSREATKGKQVERNLKTSRISSPSGVDRTHRPMTHPRPKLRGLLPNYSLKRDGSDGPALPLLTWKAVQEIINRTAYIRSAQR